MKQIQVTDVTLRDAHQSLIATRMRTDDMLPICEKLDRVGYWSLEVWGGATFDACVRYLKEDPWQRLRLLKGVLPNTRLQMLLRGQNLLGYRHYADDVVRAFVAKAAENGIDVFRVFDALNDMRNLETALKAVKDAGKHAQGTISYTTSPVHTPELFVEQAKTLRDMGADSIAIKDMAGLLAPYPTYELVKAIKSAVDLPLVIHSHSTSGLAPLCQLKAIEAGVDRIDTAISAFAGGTSHPATESQVAALKGTEWDTGLDLNLLSEIADYFREVRKKYHQFESEFTREDVSVQINQVPGGMMSNLANQLKEQNALDRIRDVFAEIPRVREDLGFPPLVTPTSQIVGTQAVYNVLSGERYKTITNEVKRYLLGGYGQPPAPINAELQRKAIGNETVMESRPADSIAPEMEKLRAKIGDLATCEEDVLTFAMFPDIGREFLQQRLDGTLQPEPLIPASKDKASGTVSTEFKVDVHGETYDVAITGVGDVGGGKRKMYISVDGMPEEVVFETIGEFVSDGAQQGRKKASDPGHVSTPLPGNVVEVLVNVGDKVASGQSTMIIEAMKMESELLANIDGEITAIHVSKGDRVTPGEVLIEIA
ncbi:MAG TPA: oxaloacetate decarboxylase subunit alpha [Methylophaga sp.]|jgi:pyruvate carboxylase subunit B|uniref:sodium-extruding oxaloacetate decarboxylase subunit alpha n=1 Tax=unclassified Methylophaga TaxID=2629249 RepID=UPI000C8FD993|nr:MULTISPECIES: sodium-extruding oxaloacetate decarboxylase subunit alpha [unclassified Methylophaga]MAK67320.1 oxaloacetate decarboxylase subunit alpha [Methylophaga sp.]HAO25276.1 oxaloacetate decarboxylase subunit alpha [Methylophaga sp.]HCD05829.1 oxaloacetate decarboxylase subunit alpha [Methylophaga sp.]|tara:strand:+ start:76337 stop:78127 length:1791 start_codon:yes stop_codon:yes gene_type:complete